MEFWSHKPNGDTDIVEFDYSDYPNIFERSFEEDTYFFSQEVKSWLVKNDIKVFVRYKTDGDNTRFFLKFQSVQDVSAFMDEYGHWGEECEKNLS